MTKQDSKKRTVSIDALTKGLFTRWDNMDFGTLYAFVDTHPGEKTRNVILCGDLRDYSGVELYRVRASKLRAAVRSDEKECDLSGHKPILTGKVVVDYLKKYAEAHK